MEVIVLIACFFCNYCSFHNVPFILCTKTQLAKVTIAHSFNISKKENNCLK